MVCLGASSSHLLSFLGQLFGSEGSIKVRRVGHGVGLSVRVMICDPRWVYKSRTTFVNLCHDKKTYWGIPRDVTIIIICLNGLVLLQATEKLGTRALAISLFVRSSCR